MATAPSPARAERLRSSGIGQAVAVRFAEYGANVANAARGIRVNGIGPGATITPINSASIDDPVKKEQVESHVPMRAPGQPTRWAAWRASSPPTTPPTSPARRSSSTAA